jgi:hypothetical protein
MSSRPRPVRRSIWIERLPLLRPPGVVEAAADRVEADDVGAELGEGHPSERGGDEG